VIRRKEKERKRKRKKRSESTRRKDELFFFLIIKITCMGKYCSFPMASCKYRVTIVGWCL